jgi:2,3-bisphosphoglycerate-independent phosphoglycerate mutase
MNRKTVLLAILDGWGCAGPSPTNAITVANTPNMDRWMTEYPFTTLVAHNGMVGLPEGQMGNSEVGHLNIGAGRIVYQDFTRINKTISSGTFSFNTTLSGIMENVKEAGSALHFFGLLSDGGVHSHIDHLKALLEMAAKKQLDRVFVHCFMDGRDTAPSSGAGFVRELVQEMRRLQCGRIATISGRYFAMDRDNRWDRVKMAWDAIVAGTGESADDPEQAMLDAYQRAETDEFIKPVVIRDQGIPVARVEDNDGIIFFNFRADRARELCRAFNEQGFAGFEVRNRPAVREFVTFTEYDREFNLPVAFPPLSMENILGEIISKQGLRQLRIAETEKYAHVTYFFNGGAESPFPGEDRILINSPRDVDTYDRKPEMSAFAVTDKLLETLEQAANIDTPYSLVVLNFANCDMVGHTGIMEAAVKACETVDTCMGRIAEYLLVHGGTLLITADHGNAEIMVDPQTGEPYTAHSLNPVPLLLIDNEHHRCTLHGGGALKDLAPTILTLLGIPVPTEMEGCNLVHCSE